MRQEIAAVTLVVRDYDEAIVRAAKEVANRMTRPSIPPGEPYPDRRARSGPDSLLD
jgi:hypothetical protein